MTLNKLNKVSPDFVENGGSIGSDNDFGGPGIFRLNSHLYAGAGASSPTIVWSFDSGKSKESLDIFNGRDVATGDVILILSGMRFSTPNPSLSSPSAYVWVAHEEFGGQGLLLWVVHVDGTNVAATDVVDINYGNSVNDGTIINIRGLDTTKFDSATEDGGRAGVYLLDDTSWFTFTASPSGGDTPAAHTVAADNSLVVVGMTEDELVSAYSPASGYTAVQTFQAGDRRSKFLMYKSDVSSGSEAPGAVTVTGGDNTLKTITMEFNPA